MTLRIREIPLSLDTRSSPIRGNSASSPRPLRQLAISSAGTGRSITRRLPVHAPGCRPRPWREHLRASPREGGWIEPRTTGPVHARQLHAAATGRRDGHPRVDSSVIDPAQAGALAACARALGGAGPLFATALTSVGGSGASSVGATVPEPTLVHRSVHVRSSHRNGGGIAFWLGGLPEKTWRFVRAGHRQCSR